MKRTTVKLPEELDARLRHEAARRGVSISEITREAIERHLGSGRKLDDRDHEACLRLLEAHPGPLIVPQLVVANVAYLLEARLGVEAEIRFLGDLAAGNLIVEPVRAADWIRIAELVGRYRDLPLGTVDASVVAVAERLGIAEVATLDRRHFGVVRPAHAPAFRMLP